MESESRVTAMSVILAVCALANILLVICLGHTWKYWRQVKWYIILLTLGNFIYVGFTQGTALTMAVSHSMGDGSTAACRFFTFMALLGQSLSAMALAAMAVHVLITCLTGCEGNRLRHALVLGLFVLLALPMPLVKMTMMEQYVYEYKGRQVSVCHFKLGGRDDHLHLEIGDGVATFFFPLLIILCCSIISAVLLGRSGRGSTKGDEDKSDLILSGILGVALLVFWTPYTITYPVMLSNPQSFSASDALANLRIVTGLRYLMDCFPSISALITIVFAYLHAFRNRGEFFVPLRESTTASGERQKLVK